MICIVANCSTKELKAWSIWYNDSPEQKGLCIIHKSWSHAHRYWNGDNVEDGVGEDGEGNDHDGDDHDDDDDDGDGDGDGDDSKRWKMMKMRMLVNIKSQLRCTVFLERKDAQEH